MMAERASQAPGGRTYIALTGLENDKTGRRFELGDVVQEGDFPAAILKHWLESGKVRLADG